MLTAKTSHLLSLFVRLAKSSSCDVHNKQAEAPVGCAVVGATPSERPASPDPSFSIPVSVCLLFLHFLQPQSGSQTKVMQVVALYSFCFLQKNISFVYRLYYITFYCRLPCKSISNQIVQNRAKQIVTFPLLSWQWTQICNFHLKVFFFCLCICWNCQFYESKNKYRKHLICLSWTFGALFQDWCKCHSVFEVSWLSYLFHNSLSLFLSLSW